MEWSTNIVVANGIRQQYYRTGGPKPPLVLLHGAGDAGLCWTPVAEALQSQFDVIMPDARGHGLSASPEEGYSSTDRAADVAALIEALGLDRPAVMGHSMGAMTALSLAALHPHSLSAVILEDPVFRLELRPAASEDQQRAWQERSRREWAQMRALGREDIIARARRNNPSWPEGDLGPWADARLQGTGAYIGKTRFPEHPGWQELLRMVTVPALLITADPDRGALVTPEAAAEARRILPSLKVVHIAGAGHNIRREQYDAFVDAVQTFLREEFVQPGRTGAGRYDAAEKSIRNGETE